MFGTIAQTARDTDYVFTVDTSIAGNTSDTQFQFRTANTSINATGSIFFEEVGNPSNNGSFNWDATSSPGGTAPIITFPSSGTYRLRVPTNINWGRPKHLAQSTYLDRQKIIEINNWGNHVMIGGLNQSFDTAHNLDIVCQDTPNFPSTHALTRAFFDNESLSDPSGSMINWDVSNCTAFNLTFQHCDIFNSNLSKWNTSKATSLASMFRHAKLYNQPMSTQEVTHYGKTYNAWDVSNVTNFSITFGGTVSSTATNVFNQDISNWNVSSGSTFAEMFSRCPNFNQPIGNWNVSSSLSFSRMFFGNSNFNQDLSNWYTGNATSMNAMFYSATSFNQDIGNWDVSNVTNMREMFYNATSFDQDIGDWDTGNVTDLYRFNQNGIINQDFSSWDLSNVSIMYQMFYNNRFFNNGGQPMTSSYQNKHGREYIGWDVGNINRLSLLFANPAHTTFTSSFSQDISNWDVSNATDISGMVLMAKQFNSDISTKQVTVGAGTALERTYNAWDVKNITNFNRLFQKATTFNQPIGNWQINTGSAINMSLMFNEAFNFNQEMSQSLQTVGTSSYKAWDVSQVTNMQQMFDDSRVFNKDIGNWNTKNVTNFSYMFTDADAFDQDLSRWDTRSATNMRQMFFKCAFTNDGNKPLTSSYYNPSDRDAYISWDTRNVTNFLYMFGRFQTIDPSPNIDISNWDTSAATDMSLMFYSRDGYLTGSFNHDISTKQVTVGAGTALERTYNAWDVKNVLNFSSMFYNNRHFNQPIGNWQINTGSATDITGSVNMASMFYKATAFNQDISSSIVSVGSKTYRAWDTKSVKRFSRMFYNTPFNKPIYNWDVTGIDKIHSSNVPNGLIEMFRLSDFNQDISSSLQTRSETGQDYIAWDVKNATYFTRMFQSSAFNKSIQNWNTISGSDFSIMFSNNSTYSHSLATQSVTINGETWDSWDVSNSTSDNVSNHGANLSGMFSNITQYKGEGLSSWNIESASFSNTFANFANFTPNYNDILISWAAQNPIYTGSIGFGSSKYDGTPGSAASASRSQLETSNGWIITDGGPV